MAPSFGQVQAYFIARNTCLGNNFGQTQFLHRQKEGTITPVPGNPIAAHFADAPPRTADNPMDAPVNVWMTWVPKKILGGSFDGGDTPAVRGWVFRFVGQCPAIDDSGNLINIQDDDFGVDPQGKRFRVENPVLSPDGCFWTFEGVRHR
jgi:hypothetical protein